MPRRPEFERAGRHSVPRQPALSIAWGWLSASIRCREPISPLIILTTSTAVDRAVGTTHVVGPSASAVRQHPSHADHRVSVLVCACNTPALESAKAAANAAIVFRMTATRVAPIWMHNVWRDRTPLSEDGDSAALGTGVTQSPASTRRDDRS